MWEKVLQEILDLKAENNKLRETIAELVEARDYWMHKSQEHAEHRLRLQQDLDQQYNTIAELREVYDMQYGAELQRLRKLEQDVMGD
jgi:uncharacterized coiled-coil DUF342 family protein